MKLFFNYDNTFKELYFDNLLIFHGNIDSQIKLYDILYKGMQGGRKEFLLDNQIVEKKELNLIEFTNNSIIDDLKLTSKSYNLKLLESVLNEEYEAIIDTMNECLKKVERNVQDKYYDMTHTYTQILPTLHFFDMKKIITDNFSLVNKEDVNISVQIELQLMVILNYIKQNPKEIFYIFIKHFEQCLDISQMNFIIKAFEVATNARPIIFTKSFELFELYYERNVNHMMNEDNIFTLHVEQEDDQWDLLTDKENEELQKALNLYRRYEAYNRIVCEKNK